MSFSQGLNSPFGMALVGDTFYVADTDAVLSFPYHTGETEIRAAPTVTALPAGTSIITGPRASSRVPTAANSSSASAPTAMPPKMASPSKQGRAAVWEIDAKTGSASRLRLRICAIRSALAWEPESGALWVAVNERDELGDHVPPDYMTALHDGAFYGWPFSYYGQHVDERVKPQNPALVANAIDAGLRARRTYRLAWVCAGRQTSQLPRNSDMDVRRSTRLVESQRFTAAIKSSSCLSPTASRRDRRSMC